jgi:hypothetical protein
MLASRYEVNQQVRAILIRHDVDLSLIDYSNVGGTIYLTGELIKGSTAEFLPSGIDELTKEITRLPGVRGIQFDLSNWIINISRRSLQIMRKKHKILEVPLIITREEGAVSTQTTIEIKSDENIADVLKDLKKKEPDNNPR